MSLKCFELGVISHCDPSQSSLLFKTFDLLIQSSPIFIMQFIAVDFAMRIVIGYLVAAAQIYARKSETKKL